MLIAAAAAPSCIFLTFSIITDDDCKSFAIFVTRFAALCTAITVAIAFLSAFSSPVTIAITEEYVDNASAPTPINSLNASRFGVSEAITFISLSTSPIVSFISPAFALI